MESKNDSETLVRRLKDFFVRWNVRTDDRVGVAYSGGRDSTVLLWAAKQIHPVQNLHAIHVDHGWRPRLELDRERELVDRTCRMWNVSLSHYGPPQEKLEGRGAEDRARRFRYACFELCASQGRLEWILTAHHEQDQAETVLMRVLQGRSWNGLSGILPRRGRYLRPFLNVSPETIAFVAQEEGLAWFEDSTNGDSAYLRNYIRRELWPAALKRFPRMNRALAEFAQRQARRRAESDRAWGETNAGHSIDRSIWERWSVDDRVEQLLSLVPRTGDSKRISRSFLASICRESKSRSWKGEGYGMRLISSNGLVSWERVVQTPTFHYFIRVRQKIWYALPDYSFVVSERETSSSDVFLPGGRIDQPLVWKTAREGERFPVSNVSSQGKRWRKRLTRGDRFEPLAFVYQTGILLAVVDPAENRRIWPPNEESKLNLLGIFVKLVQRRHS